MKIYALHKYCRRSFVISSFFDGNRRQRARLSIRAFFSSSIPSFDMINDSHELEIVSRLKGCFVMMKLY